MAALASVPRRHGAFTETKQLAALTQPLVATGELTYIRPSHLEKRTLQPQPEDLVVDADRLAITGPDGHERRMDLSGQPELRALVDTIRATLAGDLATLQRNFRLTLAGTAQSWRLILLPADARLAELVTSVTIDGTGADPRVIATAQPNGDATTLTIDPLP